MERISVERIGPDDGNLLREARLRSLADSPEAFGQTVADAGARDDADWQQQARQSSSGERRAWFLATAATGPGHSDGLGAGHAGDGATASRRSRRPLGLVQGRRRLPADLLIFSMWVDPEVRRLGVGRRLIEDVESWAREWGATRSVLWVFAANEPAIRFYRKLGFDLELDGDDAASGRTYGALAMSRAIRPGSS
ncbi:MAG: hypothetical protein QOH61_150 [Chloroflexota bacterium]|nr:hypothetical protein [Chloroflexota bacterium]